MIFLLLLSVSVLLSNIQVANGQCTIDSCKDSAKLAKESDVGHLEVIHESNQKLENLYQNLNLRLQRMNGRLEVIDSSPVKGQCDSTESTVCDCSQVKSMGYTESGVYRIYVVHQQKRIYANAYCDFTTTNGNWTSFQRRQDGSEIFFRGWYDYTIGFGNPGREFWLGNEFLYLLTSKRSYRLRIDLEDFEGQKRYAEYSTFIISSSAGKYRLSIGTYSGNAGDSLTWHNGQRFSTKDSDNDEHAGNCPVEYHGAWWYKYCAYTNLNGMYKGGNYSGCFRCGIEWEHWRGYFYSLKKTEMKISAVV